MRCASPETLGNSKRPPLWYEPSENIPMNKTNITNYGPKTGNNNSNITYITTTANMTSYNKHSNTISKNQDY
jgi:hypothetical protein